MFGVPQKGTNVVIKDVLKGWFTCCKTSLAENLTHNAYSTKMIPSFWTDRPEKTVQTQIRLLLHHLDAFIYCKAPLFEFKGDYRNILSVQKFRTFKVYASYLCIEQGCGDCVFGHHDDRFSPED